MRSHMTGVGRALTFTVMGLLAATICCAAVHADDLDEGLVGHWIFDRTVEGKVPDLTGNGNPAELQDGCVGKVDPKRGLRIPERPVEGRAFSPAHPFLAGASEQLTVAAWVWKSVMGGAAAWCPGRFTLAGHAFGVYRGEQESTLRWIFPPIREHTKQWLHLAGVIDGDRAAFYRDGQLVGEDTFSETMRQGSSDLHMGASFGRVKWQSPGYLWEVRLYDRALSADEIAQLASAHKQGTAEDLPAEGLYVPGRADQIASPFREPECGPFVADGTGALRLEEADVYNLSMSGCGPFRRVDPATWEGSGTIEVSGRASADRPVAARLMLLGWPAASHLDTSRMVARAFGPEILLGEEPVEFTAQVAVPDEVGVCAVMLTVADRREDPATLLGTEITLEALECRGGGQAAEAPQQSGPEPAFTIGTDGELSIGFDESGQVVSIRQGREELAGRGLFPLTGWFVSDYAGDNIPVPLTGTMTRRGDTLVFSGRSEKLALQYEMTMQPGGPYIDCHAEIEDLSGEDRAVMLQFRLPLTAEQSWTWHDGIYKKREVKAGRTYEVLSGDQTGAHQHRLSAFPWAPLSSDEGNVCLGVPLWEEPRQFRMHAYKPHVGGPALVCEFDAGLTPITRRFPSRADYRFVIYSTELSWPFRRALDAYQRFFPKQFECACDYHGNWANLSGRQDIPNIADYAVACDRAHEGGPWADMNRYLGNHLRGTASCLYLRPGTYSQEWEGHWEDENAYQKRMDKLAEQAQMPPWTYHFPNSYYGSSIPTLAQATLNSGIYTIDGELMWRWNVRRYEGYYYMRCQLNSSLDLPQPNWGSVQFRRYTLPDDWAKDAGVEMQGVEFDNIVPVSINAMNCRREHWELARFPLTVYKDPPQPGQSKVMILCSFFRQLREEVLRRGDFMAANIRIDPFIMAQYFDFIGHEGYQGSRLERLRLLAGRKPASYIGTGHEFVRKDFDDCLAFAVGPGLCGNSMKHRDLHQEYMPLIVELSKAGWRPVPYARYSADGAIVERYGSFDAGTLSYAVQHRTGDCPEGELRVDARGSGIDGEDVVVMNMRTNEQIAFEREGDRLLIPLPCQAPRTEVVRIATGDHWRREMLMRVSEALGRAHGEWAWLEAEHNGGLTSYEEFDQDVGRWTRSGFEGGDVRLTDDAYSGPSALLAEADAPCDGTIKTEAVVIRVGMAHRVGFHYRAEGTGEIAASEVLYPNYYGGRNAIGSVPLGDLSTDTNGEWRRIEAEVKPEGNTRKMFLQLDFSDFEGRFWLDRYSIAPSFDPLPVTPEFGFDQLRAELDAAIARGRDDDAMAILDAVAARVADWRAGAESLPSDEAERMNREIDVVESALALCRQQIG